ncbi:MAG: PEP-CTERM sorting domain-containing protein [Acidobacteria bacterium]|nr:PEP-CTERM sorting domain-containing protein [Acidobacteriota bacterium]
MKFLRTAGIAAGALALALCLPSLASAAVLTYTPPVGSSGQADLNDLDHYYMYAWRIQDDMGNGSSAFQNQTVTSAVLQFNNMQNWAVEPNALYITLLDTAYLAGYNLSGDGDPSTNGTVSGWGDSTAPDLNQVTSYQDIATGTTSAQLSNGFTDGTAKFLMSSGTNRSFLTAQTFPGPGGNFPLGSAYAVSDPTVNDTTLGTGWAKVASDSTAPFSYTYTFSAAQLTTLNNYIANGYDFALGFDPDCHFTNDGISLQLTTGGVNTQAAVPEPASILLLGTGLLAVGRRYRKSAR